MSLNVVGFGAFIHGIELTFSGVQFLRSIVTDQELIEWVSAKIVEGTTAYAAVSK